MKIPADSFIDPRKISHHLLRPLEECDKSEFLADAGYDLTDSQRLLDDIRTQLLPLDAERIGAVEHGEKFRIRGFLQGPNGIRSQVVSIWATKKPAPPSSSPCIPTNHEIPALHTRCARR